MNSHRHAGRRRARVQAMTRVFGDGTTDLQVLYTDAARYPENSAMCLAVIDNTDALVASATLRTTGCGSAEKGAIALAIVHASTLSSQDAPVTIVTDSQAACPAASALNKAAANAPRGCVTGPKPRKSLSSRLKARALHGKGAVQGANLK
ncbi:hypothetical protein HPB49_006013 [Dermacentor silvarum]|uniref:Uncharacterized protein n=1 Tax=Dermacentor silvarum TaxID=543639 RepID=A0ACB8DBA7_DERSI|nr:hypothetical protein HPB49_006013 [Dermacentor silvarum]